MASAQEIRLLHAEQSGGARSVRQDSLGTIGNVRSLAVSATGDRVLALDGNGQVQEWRRTPGVAFRGEWRTLATPPGVRKIAAGGEHTLLLLDDGTVWAAGRNDMGQLGDGTLASRTAFRQAAGLSGIADVAAGSAYSLALDRDGNVWAWGANWNAIVPSDNRKSILAPTLVPESRNAAWLSVQNDQPVAGNATGSWNWGLASAESGKSAAPAAWLVNTRESVTLSANSAFVPPAAGSGALSITADQAWTATSSNSWLTIDPSSGNGNQAATYSFTANPAANARMATITVAGHSFTVTQASSNGASTPWGILGYSVIRTIAGTGQSGFSGDSGSAAYGQLSTPLGVAVDGNGNVYIAEQSNSRVRKIAAATGIISTLAGNGSLSFSGDGGPASLATFDNIRDIAVDSSGNLFISDGGNNRVRKITAATNVISTVAGTGVAGSSGDGGDALLAQLNNPNGLALDGAGNLFIVESLGHRIRRVDAVTGKISTVAGNGTAGFSGDGGVATAASLNTPHRVAVDAAGNLYITDHLNRRVRKIDATTNSINTIAGTGATGFFGDGGAATSATFTSPSALAVDQSGNVFVTDNFDHRVRRISASDGIISTVTGNGVAQAGSEGVIATLGTVNAPAGLAFDGAGNLYIADTNNHRIRVVDYTSASVQLSPSGANYPRTAGPGSIGITATPASSLWIANAGAPWITLGATSGLGSGTLNFTMTANTAIASRFAVIYVSGVPFNVTQAGATVALSASSVSIPPAAYTGTVDLTVTPATAWTATSSASWLTVTPASGAGNQTLTVNATANTGTAGRMATIVAAGKSFTVMQSALNGSETSWGVVENGAAKTIAGIRGAPGFTGDGGEAASARLAAPQGVDTDRNGNLYIADAGNNRIRRVDAATGVITTVAGNGAPGFSGDGAPAMSAALLNPLDVAVDNAGNVYVSDSGNRRVRKIDAVTGYISTVAGTGQPGSAGDGGLSTDAQVGLPVGLALDANGNLFFVDNQENRIRRVDAATGIISRVAGGGTVFGDGGPATAALLNAPYGIVVDAKGDIYVSDKGNNRVRKVDAASGIISTVVGTGTASSTGDGGLATAATVSIPAALGVDAAGNLYILEYDGAGVRKVTASTGIISTIVPPISGSGFFGPENVTGLAVDAGGSLYIGNTGRHIVQFRLPFVPPQPPVLAAATPATATTLTQGFSITARDPNGKTDINRIYFLLSPDPTITTNSCHGYYDRTTNFIYLYNDALSAVTSLHLPASGGTSIENGQCAIVSAITILNSPATDLVLNLTVRRKGAYTYGAQKLFVWVTDVANTGTGWVLASDWLITPAQAPTLAAASPATATLATQTFSLTARDANGVADISRIYFLINSSPNVQTNGCHGYYDRIAGGVVLYSDSLATQIGFVAPGDALTIQNSQCSINGAALSVTASGTDVQLNLTITRLGSFAAGAANLYAWVTDIGNLGTGWVTASSWTIGSQQPPAVTSATPSTSSTTTQTFTITARDANGVTDISRIYFLVNSSTAIPVNTCHGFYDRALNAVFLYNDALTALSGTPGTVQNSQCAIGSFSTSSTSTDLQLTLTVTRQGSYANGAKNVYAWITDNANAGTGWVPVSTWTLAGPQPPTVASATPASSNTATQTFTITARDPDGATDISRIYFLIDASTNIAANTCHGFYDRVQNAVFLYNDALTALSGPPGTIQNSQCAIGSFSATSASTDLQLTLTVTRQGSFSNGAKTVYAWVTDNANTGTGWVPVSAWTLGGQQPPTLAAATPATAATATQTFALTARDPNGVADLNRVYFLVNANTSIPANTCHGFYDRATNALYLYNDALTALVGPLTPGAAGTLQNSQCAIDGPASAVSGSGTDLMLNLNIRRQGAYATGTRNLYIWVTDSAATGTGWVKAADWTL